jgi:hypothetical protein
MFTTYHPLLVESHFSVLICQLMLADFSGVIPTFIRTAGVVDGLEGYPIFLPPRSMAQAEFIEILERLAGGWRNGLQPHSLSAQRGKSRLAVEGPQMVLAARTLVKRSNSYQDDEDDGCSAGPSSPSSTRKNSCNGVNSGGGGSFAYTAFTQHPALSDSASQSTLATSSSSSSSTRSPATPSPIPTPAARADAVEALDSARILLAPVFKRQRERAEKAAAEKAALGGKKKPVQINIPLHGPRVEVILAWLGAVHLPELDGV